MSQSYRLKISRPALKLRVSPRIPAQLIGENFITITKVGSTYTFDVDYTVLDATAFFDPATTYVAVLDAASGTYKITSLSALIASTTQIEQHITAAGPVAVLANAGIVRVDQVVGAAITLTLPAAASKTCPVLIGDWKNDAGVNNITITPNGAEKIQGLSSWTIGGDGGSVFLRPIAGVGYVI